MVIREVYGPHHLPHAFANTFANAGTKPGIKSGTNAANHTVNNTGKGTIGSSATPVPKPVVTNTFKNTLDAVSENVQPPNQSHTYSSTHSNTHASPVLAPTGNITTSTIKPTLPPIDPLNSEGISPLRAPAIPKAASPEDAKLRQAAQQFEAVFVQQLLQQMDKTVDRSESMFNGGSAEDTFRGMFLQEVATSITQRPGGSGFGLADHIYKQMKLKMTDTNTDDAPQNPMATVTQARNSIKLPTAPAQLGQLGMGAE
jgi:Rod binding domain-containing protein